MKMERKGKNRIETCLRREVKELWLVEKFNVGPKTVRLSSVIRTSKSCQNKVRLPGMVPRLPLRC